MQQSCRKRRARDNQRRLEYYRKLTPALIQEAARTYLNTSNYVKVTLFPEKTSDQLIGIEEPLTLAG
jgi:predicted Zn-dependent peptidase